MTENKFPKQSPSNSETVSTTGENLPIPKTLLIFDFDDTLFCTKYFDSFSLPYQDIFTFKTSLEQVNPCLFKEIKELEKKVMELFIELENNNFDFVIVSNADMKWINNCLTHFLEELKEYINENQIKVYSAKNMYSNSNSAQNDEKSGGSTIWKIKCFEKVINDLYSEDNGDNINEANIDLNVLSIGDGEDEKKAVFKLNKNKFNFCQNLQSKFIRMIGYPSASSIIIQLEYLQNNIDELINSNKTIYKMSIEIVSGTTQIKCIPHKKKNKKDNLKILSIYKNSTKKLNNNSQIKKIDKDEDDIFLFNNFNIYEEYDEPENNKFYNYFDDEDNIIRNHLFLGKKKLF